MKKRNKLKLFRWAVCFLSAFLIIMQSAFPAQADSRCPGGDQHNWTEWTQVVLYDNYGNVIQGDCTKGLRQYRTCTLCGTTEYRTKEPWTHNFGPWETVRTGNCIQDGILRHTCLDCGIHEDISTGYGGHNYGDWVEVQPATCTAQGIKYAECRLCGHREYVYTDPVPHTFSEWTVKTAATDFSTGVRKRSCAVCHLEEEEVYYPDGTVFYGDNNDIVLELQRALNRGGYDCGTPDGGFGNNTWNAVTAFERDHDLPVDGIGWPGIRKILTGEEQTLRPSRDPEGGSTPEDPSNDGTSSSNDSDDGTASLVCKLRVNQSYVPEGRDVYYAGEPVVIWVNIKNNSHVLVEDVYCLEEEGGALTYDPHIYPDYKAGKDFCQKKLHPNKCVSYLYYHVITPEEADAGKYVLRVYALGTDKTAITETNGGAVRSETVEIEVKTAGSYRVPRQSDTPEDATIELKESTQAGHWMEDPSDHDGYYYYEKGEEIRYKILVKNDTDDPIYDVVIGYDFTPVKISPAKLPGQKEELPFELDPEGDAHINIEVIEAGEHRAFYLWCAAETESGDKDTMEHYARMEYNGQDGKHRSIVSEPCKVNTGITPPAVSEE